MIRVEKFGTRVICIGGIGKMFFEDGIPLSVQFSSLRTSGIEISLFHIADELLKNGFSPKTAFIKLKDELEDDIQGVSYDAGQLAEFLTATYSRQREMIHDFLFKDITEKQVDDWLKTKIINKVLS